MTTLLYAVGTGLGHLVRARAFAHGHARDVHVFTTNPAAAAVLGALPHTVVPESVRLSGAALRAALDQAVCALGAEHVILDVFPNGIRDELLDWTPPGGAVSLLVRRLLQRPEPGGPPVHTAYVCEALDPWQQDWIEQRAAHVEQAVLIDPPAGLPAELSQWLETAPRPVWAVVHSGVRSEVELLVSHARDDAFAQGLSPTIVLIHPAPPPLPDVVSWSVSPAWPMFAKVDRVVGGAGFNLVRQCLAAGVDLLSVPLPRRFDDQAGRARALRCALSRDRCAPARLD